MPVPLIIGAAAAAAALYGTTKGVSGAISHKNAQNINKDATTAVDRASQELDEQRKITNKIIEDYGQRKLRAFNGTISEFIEHFERIKNVDLTQSPEFEKLNAEDFTSQTLPDLKQNYQALKDAGLGLGAGVTGGAAMAFGAYNGTMLLATASTGTAISSLTGAAATNATLAWLGGGSLAAGGYGMAGGMVVLGSIVTGPAIAIFGHILGRKGEAALNQARANEEEAKTICDKINLMIAQLQAIAEVSTLANTTFSRVSSHLRMAVSDMKKAIDSEGEDFNLYAEESKAAVFKSVKFAQLLKAMIDTPILDQDGKLVLSTKQRFIDVNEVASGQKASLTSIAE